MKSKLSDWLAYAAQDGSVIARTILALRRQIWTVVLVFTGVTAITFLIVAITPKRYTAEMKLLVSRERSELVVSPGANNGQSPEQPDSNESTVNSEIQLMGSEGLLEKVVQERYHFSGGKGAAADRPTSLRIEQAVVSLRKRFSIEPVRKSDVINVSFEDHDPHFAGDILKTFLADYLEAHLAVHATRGGYAFFQAQADSYSKSLKDVENQLATYETKEQVFDLPTQKDLIVKAVAEAQDTMYKAQAAMRADDQSVQAARARLDSLAVSTTETRSTPNQYSIQSLRSTLLDLENKQTDLLANYLPTDRQVREIADQISNTKNMLKAVQEDRITENVSSGNPIRISIENDISRLTMDRSSNQARYFSARGEIESYGEQLSRLVSVQQQYEQLQRQQRELSDSYNLYVGKREEARVSMALDEQKFANVSVVEPPLVHYIPSHPKALLDVVLGTLLAMCLAIAAGLIKDSVLVEDAARLTDRRRGLPVLPEGTVTAKQWPA